MKTGTLRTSNLVPEPLQLKDRGFGVRDWRTSFFIQLFSWTKLDKAGHVYITGRCLDIKSLPRPFLRNVPEGQLKASMHFSLKQENVGRQGFPKARDEGDFFLNNS